MNKYFYSVESAARELGIHSRSVMRIARDNHLELLEFGEGKQPKVFFTPELIDKVRQNLCKVRGPKGPHKNGHHNV